MKLKLGGSGFVRDGRARTAAERPHRGGTRRLGGRHRIRVVNGFPDARFDEGGPASFGHRSPGGLRGAYGVEALGADTGISMSEVLPICADLDEKSRRSTTDP